MSAQLSRLRAFLAGAGELEVIAPSPAIRPDYFGRFAKLMGATVVATQMAAAAAAPVQAPPPAEPAAVVTAPAGPDRATTQASILSVKEIAARYLSHGRSPLKPVIAMMNPDEALGEEPMAYIFTNDVCRVEGIRTDYSKTDARLAVMAGTPEQRAQVLVHESMHCRLGPALLHYAARFPSPSAVDFGTTFSESSADAMAILTVARKDGVPAALSMLEHWHKVRGDEAASRDADGYHDSRETLNRIRHLLTTSPEKLDSDGAAFALAITEGVIGASKTFAAALPANRKDYIGSPEFKTNMAGFHQAVEEMARGYLEGRYELGAPEITLNDQTLAPGSPAAPSTWQLLAKKLGAQPFTAAGLRKQVEEITDSIITAAVGEPSSTLVAATLAPTPAPHMGPAAAIGRLRSHLSAIYVDPVPVDEALLPELDQRSIAAPGQPAM